MNDFPDLTPPPERRLSDAARARVWAPVADQARTRRRHVLPVAAAAATAVVVGAGAWVATGGPGGTDHTRAPYAGATATPTASVRPADDIGGAKLCVIDARSRDDQLRVLPTLRPLSGDESTDPRTIVVVRSPGVPIPTVKADPDNPAYQRCTSLGSRAHTLVRCSKHSPVQLSDGSMPKYLCALGPLLSKKSSAHR